MLLIFYHNKNIQQKKVNHWFWESNTHKTEWGKQRFQRLVLSTQRC